MKFLFLDIEGSNKFSTENNICLINELVSDEHFEVTAKKEIIINPVKDFDDYVLKNLPYEKNVFDEAKKFGEIYDELADDLEQEMQVIIVRNGYNDIKMLKEECFYKSLPPFTFKFYDFNEIFMAAKRCLDKELSVKLEEPKFTRNGTENALMMYNKVKQICDLSEKSIQELLFLAVNSEGVFEDGFINFKKTKDVINPENTFNSNLNKNSNYKVFLRLLENLRKTTDAEEIYAGKNVSISTGYEAEHFKEMVNLVMIMKELGATYVTDMNKCDIFIQKDTIVNGKVKKCNRLNKINELKSGGKLIEIITLEDFLSKADKTENNLSLMPLPDLEFIYGENSNKAKPSKKYLKIRKNFGKI